LRASAPQSALPAISALSLDQKVGQLFVHPGRAVFMNESSAVYRELLRQVKDNGVGGVIWFLSNVYEAAVLNARLQQAAAIPLLISADLEMGVGMRFLDTTWWPPAMAFAAAGDPALAEEEGRVVAREAKAIGINHILAPVADVNVNPDNPVINARSFGEDPDDVARFVTAFIRGVQSEGVLATVKHFPGHGDTHVDSHRALPVIDVTRERLDAVELVPFRAAIAAGVKSVMIGHLAVPALDPTPAPVRGSGHAENPYGTHDAEITRSGTLPATLSAKMVDELLRRDLGFDGLVVSDAFDMGGITEHFDAGEAAVRAIEAGEDQVMLSPNIDAAIAGVKAAVKSGRIAQARIDRSVERILDAKSFAGAPMPRIDDVFRIVDAAPHREIAALVARRSLTLLRDGGLLPLGRRPLRLITVIDLDPLADFERELRARTEVREDAELTIVAFAIRARSGAGTIALPAKARAIVESLDPSKTIGIAFGTPYLLREVPRLTTYLCAWGPQPVLQVAAAQALFGETPITGTLPATIPGLHTRGEGIRRVLSAER
jgi:beta-glucosidase-like glycosyl hydrolase